MGLASALGLHEAAVGHQQVRAVAEVGFAERSHLRVGFGHVVAELGFEALPEAAAGFGVVAIELAEAGGEVGVVPLEHVHQARTVDGAWWERGAIGFRPAVGPAVWPAVWLAVWASVCAGPARWALPLAERVDEGAWAVAVELLADFGGWLAGVEVLDRGFETRDGGAGFVEAALQAFADDGAVGLPRLLGLGCRLRGGFGGASHGSGEGGNGGFAGGLGWCRGRQRKGREEEQRRGV